MLVHTSVCTRERGREVVDLAILFDVFFSFLLLGVNHFRLTQTPNTEHAVIQPVCESSFLYFLFRSFSRYICSVGSNLPSRSLTHSLTLSLSLSLSFFLSLLSLPTCTYIRRVGFLLPTDGRVRRWPTSSSSSGPGSVSSWILLRAFCYFCRRIRRPHFFS